MTPGYKTSEFMLTVATILANVIGLIPAQYSMEATILVGVYTALRTFLKLAHAEGVVMDVPDLPALPTSVADSTSGSTGS